MREWLTPKQIAEERLPEMPNTERGVQMLAAREAWDAVPACARKRSGRGGGMEYNVALLPTLALVAYRQRHLRIGRPDMPPAANDAVPAVHPTLSGRALLERDARLAILRSYDAFARGQRLNQSACEYFFIMKWESGQLQIDDWVRDCVKTISKSSLARWRREAKTDKDRLAVDRSTARKGKGVIETANDGQLRLFVLGLIAHQPFLAAAEVRRQCRAEFGDTVTIVSGGATKTIEMPPVRTFQHALKALKAANEVVLTKLTNPDLFRSTMKVSGVGTLRNVVEPNSLWQIDASPIDALCSDGRKTVYACIDIATRRATFLVSDTPRASAVGLLIRKAILAWGVPAAIKTDNGSDFVARATKRLFASLDIEMRLSDAYSPEQKGHIERLIRTFQHQFTTLLPGFVGHSVADRKAIEGRKSFAARMGEDEAETFGVALTGAELQALIDEWAEVQYSHAPHGGLKGATPFQMAASAAHTVRRVDVRALDILLMPAVGKDGMRTVTKFGIRIDHYHYLISSLLPGRQVFVRRDPGDLGRVYAFADSDGGFLGEAICAELAGIHPETFVRAEKDAQAELLRRAEKDIKAKMRELRSGRSLIERSLEIARRDMPNVVALPRPEAEHSTPAIAAALDAAAPATPIAAPMSDRAAEIHAELVAEFERDEPPQVVPLRKSETPQLRFRRALDIEARFAAGESVGEETALWLGGYQTGPEYRAMRKVYDDFGGEISL